MPEGSVRPGDGMGWRRPGYRVGVACSKNRVGAAAGHAALKHHDVHTNSGERAMAGGRRERSPIGSGAGAGPRRRQLSINLCMRRHFQRTRRPCCRQITRQSRHRHITSRTSQTPGLPLWTSLYARLEPFPARNHSPCDNDQGRRNLLPQQGRRFLWKRRRVRRGDGGSC
jgi:hypothetical protein